MTNNYPQKFKLTSVYATLAVLLLAVVGFGLHLFDAPKTEGSSTKPEGIDFFVGLPGNGSPISGKVQLPILMYHHIGPLPKDADALTQGLTVSAEDFEKQISWIHSQGFNSITLEQAYAFSQGKSGLPKKPIVFTFDDGYNDALNYGTTILEKYGYTGSFAVITSWPGIEVGTNSYATWETILAAHKRGHEIVCHTQDHFDGSNPKFNSDFIYKNLSGCKKDLLDHGLKTNVLVYPYGHYSADYVEQAKKAGFTLALTVEAGDVISQSNLMTLPRIRIHGHQNFELLKELLSK